MRRTSLLLAGLTLVAGCTDEVIKKVTCGAHGIVQGNACVPAPASCTPFSAGAIVEKCKHFNRTCYEDAAGAVCGVCLSGFRDAGDACRPVRTCEQLDCAATGRACLQGGERTDSVCGACLEGNVDAGAACVPASCASDDGVARDCAVQSRTCVDGEGGPACGPCLARFVDEAGNCRAVHTCDTLGCAAVDRLCVPEQAGVDASCGGCIGGFQDAAGACVRDGLATCTAGDTRDITSRCRDVEHRGCSADPDGALCDGCLAGFGADAVSGLCLPHRACTELDCATQLRVCEEKPYGHCDRCVPGYTEDAGTGECRPVRRCSETECQVGEVCVPETATADALCQTDCAPGSLRTGDICAPCPPCDGVGEDGPSTSATTAGACICKTKRGYFYSVGGDVGTVPCDADHDGWVRESARNVLESGDPALVANARCDLRVINSFVLRTEGGEEKTVPLSAPLELYETDRNDDDGILAARQERAGIPPYRSGAVDVSAAELNRLTKLCFARRGDYNDNGVPDVEEWGSRAPAPSFRTDQIPFNTFSYFAELNRGYFEKVGTDPLRGHYVIEERSRAADAAAGRAVAVTYPVDDPPHDYWRQCTVLRDSEWQTQSPPMGMDFAEQQTPGSTWPGMNHHSQFKCLVIDNEPRDAVPSELTVAEAIQRRYSLNRCRGTGATTADGNPADPVVGCSLADASAAQPGDVYWGAVPFLDYDPYAKWPLVPDHGYVRGCVNECSESLPQCPSWDVNPVAVNCTYANDDFGHKVECQAYEVCDGLDNDLDGAADDGDPGGGYACKNDGVTHDDVEYPGEGCVLDADCDLAAGFQCDATLRRCVLRGVCVPGTTHCNSGLGKVVCTPAITPRSQTETCNTLDDDCNGIPDDGDPGGGVQTCTVVDEASSAVPKPYKKGNCAYGTLSCNPATGAYDICVQYYQPQDEYACNGFDENCDGATDNSPQAVPQNGACPSGWTAYYKDADNDGYGDSGDTGQCLCNPNSTYKRTTHNDCCDSDGYTYPASAWRRLQANVCGQWDYNCDGVVSKSSDTSTGGGCGTCCSGFCCCDGSTGWKDSVPACGASHDWYTGGCTAWSPCRAKFTSYSQYCW